ncbi:exocyst complex subunit Sec8 [Schizosaccharomyces japonicus yFS275]|uniref:Exocyst complex component Sec8 n=1 Tax=Schizosaccharomyces japonicus (strain yFS275 / FY16936) TaxID=402676 RepID=B6K255_SCHJY|nr:exocyst complex subunit Sec8 [Schizosaccharomyces japonicus yFS275]EEB07236.1 exocyst complex subunit Sec8 [Schizosaccharomyces japonicus yFS275]
MHSNNFRIVRREIAKNPPENRHGDDELLDSESSSSQNRTKHKRGMSKRFQQQELEGLINDIEDEWKDLFKENYNPLSTALELLDKSSFGRGYENFIETYDKVKSALQRISSENKEDFMQNVTAYGRIMDRLNVTTSKVLNLKASLKSAQSSIDNITGSSELLQLLSRSAQLNIIIETLQSVHSAFQSRQNIETLIKQKKYYEASQLLVKTSQTLSEKSFEGISSVDGLRSQISAMESSFFETLVDELTRIVFLRSDTTYSLETPKDSPITTNPFFLREFLDSINKEPSIRQVNKLKKIAEILQEPLDKDRYKEHGTDSFRDLRMVLESLNNLNKLRDALAVLKQRTPAEVYYLVDCVVKHADTTYSAGFNCDIPTATQSIFDAMFDSKNEQQSKIFERFFHLFSLKLDTLVFHYRLIGDYLTRLVGTDSMGVSRYEFSYSPLWDALKNELGLLLKDYLITPVEYSYSKQSKAAASDSTIHTNYEFDQNKSFFSSVNGCLPQKDDKSFAAELTKIVKDFSLINVGKSNSNTSTTDLNLYVNQQGSMKFATNHKIIAYPSIFDAPIVLMSVVSLLTNFRYILDGVSNVPQGAYVRVISAFLKDTFLPHFTDIIFSYFDDIMNDPDAFKVHPDWIKFHDYPIYKGFVSTLQFVESLTNSFPVMASNLVEYYEILLKVLRKLESKAVRFVNELCVTTLLKKYKFTKNISDLGTETARLKTVGNEKLFNSFSSLWNSPDQPESEWTELYLTERKGSLFYGRNEEDIENLPKSIISRDSSVASQIAYLYNSLIWFNKKCFYQFHANKTEKENTSENNIQYGRPLFVMRVLDYDNPQHKSLIGDYETVIRSYRDLSYQCLLLLRMEIRLLYFNTLVQIVKVPNFILEYKGRPDDVVIELDSTIISVNFEIERSLPERERAMIWKGLDFIVDHQMYEIFRSLKSMNRGACLQTLRNLAVMVQTLKIVNDNPDAVGLMRSIRAFGVYRLGLKKVTEFFASKPTASNYEDVKHMVSIFYRKMLNEAQAQERDDLVRQYTRKEAAYNAEIDRIAKAASIETHLVKSNESTPKPRK